MKKPRKDRPAESETQIAGNGRLARSLQAKYVLRLYINGSTLKSSWL